MQALSFWKGSLRSFLQEISRRKSLIVSSKFCFRRRFGVLNSARFGLLVYHTYSSSAQSGNSNGWTFRIYFAKSPSSIIYSEERAMSCPWCARYLIRMSDQNPFRLAFLWSVTWIVNSTDGWLCKLADGTDNRTRPEA